MKITRSKLEKMLRKPTGFNDKNKLRLVIKVIRIDGYNEAIKDVISLVRKAEKSS